MGLCPTRNADLFRTAPDRARQQRSGMTDRTKDTDAAPSHLYARWVTANGLSEGLGLGTTFAVGFSLVPHLGQTPGAGSWVAVAVLAVLMGMLLEGVVVGAAQSWALRPRLPFLPPWKWIMATALGAGVAWALGMVPSTVMAVAAGPQGAPSPAPPAALFQYGAAALMGLVLGPILGLAQWMVLRHHVERAASWLWANAVAWAVGMPMIFLGMEFVPWDRGGVPVYASAFAVCLAAGLVVGAVHGRWVLDW